MSITNLLDQGVESQDWVNLRVNNITIDNSLILSPSAQNVLAGTCDFSRVITGTDNVLLATDFEAVNPGDIDPVGINYISSNITVETTGYYLINCKVQAFITSYSAPENMYLIFSDDIGILLEDIVYVNNSGSHSLQINRLVKLIEGENYELYLNQDTAQSVTIRATSSCTYLSIVKLF